MKNLMLILLAGIILVSCTAKKDNFNILGSISGNDSVMIFLQKPGIVDGKRLILQKWLMEVLLLTEQSHYQRCGT